MAKIKEWIYNKLQHPDIVAIVGDNIYPYQAPKKEKNEPKTVIIYNRIAETQIDDIVSKGLYQISIYSYRMSEAEILSNLIKSLFNNYRGEEVDYCWVSKIHDMYYPETNDYGIHLQLDCKIIANF